MIDQGIGSRVFIARLQPRNERRAAGRTILPELGELRRRGTDQNHLPGKAERINNDYYNLAGSQ